jgi:hypothetical protein
LDFGFGRQWSGVQWAMQVGCRVIFFANDFSAKIGAGTTPDTLSTKLTEAVCAAGSHVGQLAKGSGADN